MIATAKSIKRLINAVLTALPIYFFSFFRVPQKIIEKLVNIQCRFLWGGGSEQKKIARVNWETVCLPKDKGGLGIKDQRMFNTALLGKWRWEIFQHNVELWTRILLSKYGGWRNLDGHRRSCYHSHWWKDLQLLNQQQQTIALKRQIEWRVGCGDKIKFWEDTWTADDRPLMVKYASLYQISNQQQQTISLMGSHNDEGWEWNFSWRRNLFDNEATMAAEFIQETAVLTVQQQGADSWVWKADPSGNYSTKSAYDILLEAKRGETDDGPFVELWKLRIPPKTATFAWRLIRDRLPTKANHRRRQVELTDSRCPLCNNMEENAAHLFFNCSKTIPSGGNHYLG